MISEKKNIFELANALCTMCLPFSPTIKKGQALKVKKGKKYFKIIVTKPNGKDSDICEGRANNKTFICKFIGGEWIVIR